MTASRLSPLLLALAVLAAVSCEPTKGSAPAPSASAATPMLDENASCPKRFQDLPATDQQQDSSCLCPATDLGGQVWGSGIYTADSAICAAAVHAGAIGSQGGRVTARSAPGCASYLGSSNNRVTTSPRAREERSFYFPSVSDGKCAAEPKR